MQLLSGFHSVEAALLNRPAEIQHIWLVESRNDQRVEQNTNLASQHHVPIHLVSRKELDRLVRHTAHQGIAASVAPLAPRQEKDLQQDLAELTRPLFLVLDGVQDPHNLGACLRSAHGFGISGIVLPDRNTCPLSETVHRGSAGALEFLRIYRVANLARSLRHFSTHDVQRIAISQAASRPIAALDLCPATVFVLGGEGKGLRRLTQVHCDLTATIPMAGNLESLNLSVAAGICLYEASRQRRVIEPAPAIQ